MDSDGLWVATGMRVADAPDRRRRHRFVRGRARRGVVVAGKGGRARPRQDCRCRRRPTSQRVAAGGAAGSRWSGSRSNCRTLRRSAPAHWRRPVRDPGGSVCRRSVRHRRHTSFHKGRTAPVLRMSRSWPFAGIHWMGQKLKPTRRTSPRYCSWAKAGPTQRNPEHAQPHSHKQSVHGDDLLVLAPASTNRGRQNACSIAENSAGSARVSRASARYTGTMSRQ